MWLGNKWLFWIHGQWLQAGYWILDIGYCLFQCCSVENKNMACVISVQLSVVFTCMINNSWMQDNKPSLFTIKQLLYKIFLHNIHMYIHSFMDFITAHTHAPTRTTGLSCSWVTAGPRYEAIALCSLVGGYRSFGGTFSLNWKLNSMVWVRERTISTERPPLVGEVIANLCG
jgi:hypothetical protein